MMNINEQIDYLLSGGIEILPLGRQALADKLKKAESKKEPLRIKLGIDPTAADLHLGHTVCLQLLKRFLELGHKPILIFGGFTAQLGDPTGRNEARPSLSEEEVAENTQKFLQQVSKVIDINKVEIVNNADWLKPLTLKEIIKLASSTTVNQIIGKEAFGERLEQGHPLYLHEILYPLLQGYDSVAIKADIEIGGQDQRFNVLAGRDLQKYFAQDLQIVMLIPLLIGLDGKKKMSKTANNFIGLTDIPEDIYGKTMSLPDLQMLNWYSLATGASIEEIKDFTQKYNNPEINPRDLKRDLAKKLIELYYSTEEAQKAEQNFITKFQKKEIPDERVKIKLNENCLIDLIVEADIRSGLTKSEAKRLIVQGGIKLNGHKVEIETALKSNFLKVGDIIQIGKRDFLELV